MFDSTIRTHRKEYIKVFWSRYIFKNGHTQAFTVVIRKQFSCRRVAYSEWYYVVSGLQVFVSLDLLPNTSLDLRVAREITRANRSNSNGRDLPVTDPNWCKTRPLHGKSRHPIRTPFSLPKNKKQNISFHIIRVPSQTQTTTNTANAFVTHVSGCT